MWSAGGLRQRQRRPPLRSSSFLLRCADNSSFGVGEQALRERLGIKVCVCLSVCVCLCVCMFV